MKIEEEAMRGRSTLKACMAAVVRGAATNSVTTIRDHRDQRNGGCGRRVLFS